MRRVTLVLGVTAIMAVVIASSAAAAKPVVNGPIHDEGTVFFADCGEFQILDRYVLDVTVRVFFDETGTPIRAVQEARACRHLADSQAWLELLHDAADSG